MKTVVFMPLLAAVVLGLACSDNADSRVSMLTVIPDTDYFHLTASAPDGGYNLERTYPWRCTSQQAEVIFDSIAGTYGTIHVIFRDAAGQVVYEKTYIDPGSSFICEDTAAGLSGTWSTYIEITDLYGTFTIAAGAK